MPDRALVAAQNALLDALTGRAALPEGFAQDRAHAMREILLTKRRRAVVHVCPAVRTLGDSFSHSFAEYAAGVGANSDDATADAIRFLEWLRERDMLTRELAVRALALRLVRGFPARATWIAERRMLVVGYRSLSGRTRCWSLSMPGNWRAGIGNSQP